MLAGLQGGEETFIIFKLSHSPHFKTEKCWSFENDSFRPNHQGICRLQRDNLKERVFLPHTHIHTHTFHNVKTITQRTLF